MNVLTKLKQYPATSAGYSCILGGIMGSERKFEYQRRKMEQMQEEIGRLKSANLILEHDNAALTKTNEILRNTLEKLETETAETMGKYEAAVGEAIEAKHEYERLRLECIAARNKFEKMTKKLLGDFRAVQ